MKNGLNFLSGCGRNCWQKNYDNIQEKEKLKMRITNDEKKESQRLTELRKAAQEVDLESRAKELDVEILKAATAEEEFRILEYAQKRMEARNRKEALLSAKRKLTTDKMTAVESGETMWIKFHRPFQAYFVDELGRGYTKVEKLKTYSETAVHHDDTFGLPVHTVQSNILSVLKTLLRISAEIIWFKSCRVPLSEQLQRFETDQKEFAAVEFEMKETRIFGTGEFLNFSTYFGNRAQYLDEDWKPLILSSETLAKQITGLGELTKPKVIHVA
jgi:hypothetical protein